MIGINKSSVWKILKITLIGAVIFVLGGFGGIFFERYVLPRANANPYLSKLRFVRRAAENVTIINRTEQIMVREDDSINEIASRTANAVVNIVSVKNTRDPLTRISIQESHSGGGVILTSDGFIVTYRTAIFEEGAKYNVFLYDGANHEATLVGIDEFTNLAYLRINASNLPVAPLADSGDFGPGKKLVAISNSFGEYQNRFASGLLSNRSKTFNLGGKTVAQTEKLEGVFETDFNGHSEFVGGPAIAYNGDMVGINGSLVIDNDIRYFLIPSNMVKSSMELALRGDLDKRPNFGAYYMSITKEYSLTNAPGRDRGALIYAPSGRQSLAVIADSPAEKAGIRLGDIIVSVDGKDVNLDNPLSNLISQRKKGETVKLGVLRDGKLSEIQVQL